MATPSSPEPDSRDTNIVQFRVVKIEQAICSRVAILI